MKLKLILSVVVALALPGCVAPDPAGMEAVQMSHAAGLITPATAAVVDPDPGYVHCPGAVPPCEGDQDCDGVPFGIDLCDLQCDPEQPNSDGDPLSDICDPCDEDPADDIDRDGICGGPLSGSDNCPAHHNTSQVDTDGDGHGDPCDEYPNGDPA